MGLDADGCFCLTFPGSLSLPGLQHSTMCHLPQERHAMPCHASDWDRYSLKRWAIADFSMAAAISGNAGGDPQKIVQACWQMDCLSVPGT